MSVATYSAVRPSVPKSVPKSLCERDSMEQVRSDLGIGWRLPKVVEAALASYYRYLSERLALPVVAWYHGPAGSPEEREHLCTVIELIDPASGVGDAFDGIFCTVRKGKHELILPLIELELPPESPNYQLVENYWDWFWHWR